VTFYSEKIVKSLRRPRHCGACGHAMAIGEFALYCSGKWHGEFWTGHYHEDCRRAEVALNGEYGDGEQWWDLASFDADDLEFIRETHPVAFARLSPPPPMNNHEGGV
jgi:hypothetical protein